MTQLIEATDEHFLWIARGEGEMAGLALPPGGVEEPAVLPIVRRMTARLRAAGSLGSFILAADGEIVGFCGYKWPPAGGTAEIGYSVVPARRRLGHATRALAGLVTWAAADPKVHTLTAETLIANLASQAVLSRNRFCPVGTRYDREDGEVALWRRPLGP